jgi:hypothetical protein
MIKAPKQQSKIKNRLDITVKKTKIKEHFYFENSLRSSSICSLCSQRLYLLI